MRYFAIGFALVSLAGCSQVHEWTRPEDKTVLVHSHDETIVFARQLPAENEQQVRAIFSGVHCTASLTAEQHVVVVCNEEPPVAEEAAKEEKDAG